jgi:hypothetical protein
MSDTKLRYEFLERRVRGQACVDIYVLSLPVPRYSFKVSAARVSYGPDGEKSVTVIPFVSLLSFADASDLLMDVGREFEERRESAKADTMHAIGEQINAAPGSGRK